MISTQTVVRRLFYVLSVLAAAGVAETTLFRGFLLPEPPKAGIVISWIYTILLVLYVVWVILKIISMQWNFRGNLHDILLVVLIIGAGFPERVMGSIISFRIILSLLVTFMNTTGIGAFLSEVRLNPARILLLSFVGVIVAGMVLLMLPAATADRMGAGFFDALFTSTSATCVTGLIVKDTGTYFSPFGRGVILILIQLGALGIMTHSTLFALILGRRLGLKQEEQLQGLFEESSKPEMYRLVAQIVKITFALEIAGALCLYARWAPNMGSREAAESAVFHSISAFCNAGFSLYSNSMTRFAGDIWVNGVIIVLIILGGLGFVVTNDLMKNTRRLNPFTLNWTRLTVHTKLVLIITGVLLGIGTLSVFYFEFDNAMLGMSTPEKLLASFFQSVTFRTAGFNTIDFSGMREVTLFIGIILMFIGASPSSTGGGIKTSTLAVMLLSVRSLMLSRERVEIFNRTIPHETVYKAVAITIFSSTILIVFSVMLLATQQGGFVDIMFEAVSALGTVGLSTGVTGSLDSAGKVLVTLLMYIGRVGPLTVALALGDVKKVKVRYPLSRVGVG